MPDSDTSTVYIYIHGGGIESGSRKVGSKMPTFYTDRSIAFASIEYRMYPTAKFPEFIEDCAYAVRWLKDNISEYGKCDRIFVGGSSAGGYLSMMLCFDDRYFEAVGMKPTDIAAYIHDAGQPTSHFNVAKELGNDPRRVIVDETAPLFFVGMKEKYSPMLFLVSDNDMFARYEQTVLMVKTLEHFGHTDNVALDVRSGEHCEYVYKSDENGNGQFANLILNFLENQGLINK